MKLTNTQKKKIIALHADGISQTKLAAQFHVSRTTIKAVLDADADFAQKAAVKNKEMAEKEALSFVERMRDRSEGLIDKIISSVQKDFNRASVRDRMGAIKVLFDCFCSGTSKDDSKNALDQLCDAINNIGKDGGVNGE